MQNTAKLFNDESGQAVRLPEHYRFDTDEVFIRRDEQTGAVILTPKPSDSPKRGQWDGFFRALERLKAEGVPEDFLSPEERHQPDSHRDPFEDE